jgi:hypothetical protein
MILLHIRSWITELHPHPRYCKTCQDGHKGGEGIEANVTEVIDTVWQDRLNTFVYPSQEHSHNKS